MDFLSVTGIHILDIYLCRTCLCGIIEPIEIHIIGSDLNLVALQSKLVLQSFNLYTRDRNREINFSCSLICLIEKDIVLHTRNDTWNLDPRLIGCCINLTDIYINVVEANLLGISQVLSLDVNHLVEYTAIERCHITSILHIINLADSRCSTVSGSIRHRVIYHITT